jgi:hypothetical protein
MVSKNYRSQQSVILLFGQRGLYQDDDWPAALQVSANSDKLILAKI